LVKHRKSGLLRGEIVHPKIITAPPTFFFGEKVRFHGFFAYKFAEFAFEVDIVFGGLAFFYCSRGRRKKRRVSFFSQASIATMLCNPVGSVEMVRVEKSGCHVLLIVVIASGGWIGAWTGLITLGRPTDGYWQMIRLGRVRAESKLSCFFRSSAPVIGRFSFMMS
jgi:hypothetical protein